MNIAAALPLGFASRCEVLDMRLEQDVPLDGLTEKLNDTMPEGIRVTHIEQVMDERAPALQTQVVSAEYKVNSKEADFGSDLKRKIDSVMESESIPRTRRNKEYNLRPLIEMLELTPENELFMRLTAKEGATRRPEEVLDVLDIAFEETRIERTRLNFKK
jgi:radical SAM-linked protein